MTRVDAVVFDLGNVLIRWDPRRLYSKIFKNDHKAMEDFLSNVCTMDWNERHDAGYPIAQGTKELISLFPEHEPHIRAYFGRWAEMLGGAIEANVAVLEQLHAKKMPLYALSNWSAETFPIARPQFSFFDLFQGIVLSGEEGVIKPDPQIYEILLTRYKLTPETTVFVDDAAKNIAAAERLGMNAIHFTSDCDLAARFRNLGIL